MASNAALLADSSSHLQDDAVRLAEVGRAGVGVDAPPRHRRPKAQQLPAARQHAAHAAENEHGDTTQTG